MARARHQGGCLCGAIRYEIVGPIPPGSYCHCSMCRKASGGAAMPWISVPRERFRFTRGTPAIYKSSPSAERSFCGRCGSPLTFFTEGAAEDIDVSLGTLDHPEDHPPDRHIFSASKLRWLHLDEHLPEYEEWTPSGHGGVGERG